MTSAPPCFIQETGLFRPRVELAATEVVIPAAANGPVCPVNGPNRFFEKSNSRAKKGKVQI